MLPSASVDSVGTPNSVITRLNSPACTYPCERFATPSRDVDASLGAAVGRYPFDVELFHLLLHAGLSRRSYGTVRLPTPVHPRITASAFPERPAR